jgi:hypothetical protein
MVVKTGNKSYFIDARPNAEILQRIEKIEKVLIEIQELLLVHGILTSDYNESEEE